MTTRYRLFLCPSRRKKQSRARQVSSSSAHPHTRRLAGAPTRAPCCFRLGNYIPTGYQFIPSSSTGLARGLAHLGNHDETLGKEASFFFFSRLTTDICSHPLGVWGCCRLYGIPSRIARIADRFRFSPRTCQGRACIERTDESCSLLAGSRPTTIVHFLLVYFSFTVYISDSSLLTFVSFPFSPLRFLVSEGRSQPKEGSLARLLALLDSLSCAAHDPWPSPHSLSHISNTPSPTSLSHPILAPRLPLP